MMNLFQQWLPLIESYVVAYGVIAIFVVIYLESFGAPLPGETAVIGAALLASKGELHVAALFMAVLAAAVLGDATGYVIGRFGGRRLLHHFGPYVRLTAERLSSFESQFRRKGPYVVAGARFVPLLRQVNGLIAGAMNMPWHVFIAAQVVGALAWSGLYTFGPFFFASVFERLR